MIKFVLYLIIIFLLTNKNLYLYQIQYYSLNRFIKLKLKTIYIKYLFIIPLIILNFYLNNEQIISGLLLLFIFINIKKDIPLDKLKYTFRVNRMLIIHLTINSILLLNKQNLIMFLLLIIFNTLLLVISNYIDAINRIVINYINIKKLKNKLNSIKPIIIGITGSYGKTSTKNYLEQILKTKYNVLKTSGNINTFKGIINYLNKYLNNNINLIIIEIGLDKKNGINKFLKLFKFDYGFVTGIEKCHLATFKTIDNIINEKLKLLKHSKTSFINIDNKYYQTNDYISYSLNDLEYIRYIDNYTIFKIKNIDKEFKTSLIGTHHLLNLIGCIKCSIELKININNISKSIINIKNEKHRYELKKYNELLIIDDAYNSNETGFKYALDSLQYFNLKKVIITPGIIELGKENYEINYKIGKYLVNKVDEVILIGKNSISIKKALDDSNFKNYMYFNTYIEGIKELLKRSDKEFITLIENDLLDDYLC